MNKQTKILTGVLIAVILLSAGVLGLVVLVIGIVEQNTGVNIITGAPLW